VTQALLARYLPPEGSHAFYVCGPPRMMDVVEIGLARLGVPLGDIHSERFDLV
jgi:predicted ferric reductase